MVQGVQCKASIRILPPFIAFRLHNSAAGFKPGNAFQGINLVKAVRTFLLVKCSESETGSVISFVLFTLWAIRKTVQQNGARHASQP